MNSWWKSSKNSLTETDKGTFMSTITTRALMAARKLFPTHSQKDLQTVADQILGFIQGVPEDQSFWDFIIEHGPVHNQSWQPRSYQRFMACLLERDTNTILHVSRQLGCTTILILFALWQASRSSNQSIVYLSNNRHMSSHSFQTATTIAHNSNHIKCANMASSSGQQDLIFSNGSKIQFVNRLPTDQSINLLVVDEQAFIPHAVMRDILDSSLFSRFVMGGVPGKLVSPTSEVWHRDSGWTKAEFPWFLDESRSDTWAAEQLAMMGEAKFESEYNCKFT